MSLEKARAVSARTTRSPEIRGTSAPSSSRCQPTRWLWPTTWASAVCRSGREWRSSTPVSRN